MHQSNSNRDLSLSSDSCIKFNLNWIFGLSVNRSLNQVLIGFELDSNRIRIEFSTKESVIIVFPRIRQLYSYYFQTRLLLHTTKYPIIRISPTLDSSSSSECSDSS